MAKKARNFHVQKDPGHTMKKKPKSIKNKWVSSLIDW